MLDIKFIRQNKDLIADNSKKRGVSVDVDALLNLDDKRRALTRAIEEKRA